MARAATTTDLQRRRGAPPARIIDVLAGGERPVNDLVATLGLAQPQVSKHLRVLREVGPWTCATRDGSGCTGSTGGR